MRWSWGVSGEPRGAGRIHRDRFRCRPVVVAIARLVLFGWAGVAPDDARYVFVGLSTFDGHGPITPSGNVFLLRSPVYGIAVAAGSVIARNDPVAGAGSWPPS